MILPGAGTKQRRACVCTGAWSLQESAVQVGAVLESELDLAAVVAVHRRRLDLQDLALFGLALHGELRALRVHDDDGLGAALHDGLDLEAERAHAAVHEHDGTRRQRRDLLRLARLRWVGIHDAPREGSEAVAEEGALIRRLD